MELEDYLCIIVIIIVCNFKIRLSSQGYIYQTILQEFTLHPPHAKYLYSANYSLPSYFMEGFTMYYR